MVIFEQLRISDDGTQLFIDAHVNTSEHFANVYFDTLTIMTAKEVEDSADPLSPSSTHYVYKKTYGDNVKEDSLTIGKGDFDEAWSNGQMTTPDSSKPVATDSYTGDFRGQMFFVYIKTKGCADECVPCPWQNEMSVGATYDKKSAYDAVMNYTKELASSCQPSADFIDYILRQNALDAAIKTKHFIPAIDFWKMLFGEDGQALTSTTTKNCRCNG